MRKIAFPLALFIFVSFAAIEANEITCEQFVRRSDGLTCALTNYTAIDSPDSTFSGVQSNEIDELNLSYNTKVKFLPVALHQKFPNLKFYQASRCSLREITKKNFENLSNLRELRLSRNEIEIIKSDTFQGLQNLAEIYLGNNKIAKIEAHSFDNLPALKQVWLESNACINQAFYGTKLPSLSRTIADQCSEGKKHNPYATRAQNLAPSQQTARKYVLRNNF